MGNVLQLNKESIMVGFELPEVINSAYELIGARADIHALREAMEDVKRAARLASPGQRRREFLDAVRDLRIAIHERQAERVPSGYAFA